MSYLALKLFQTGNPDVDDVVLNKINASLDRCSACRNNTVELKYFLTELNRFVPCENYCKQLTHKNKFDR